MRTMEPSVHRPVRSAAESGYGFYPRFNSVNEPISDKLSDLIQGNGSNELDYDALNVFLRIGTFIGTDTPFRHIKADPPDYEWATTRTIVQESRPQIIDSYIDLFRQAVKRCDSHSQTVGVGLSGGRDSRHILLELCNSGRAPSQCWTIDLPSNPAEALIAQELCGRLGVAHSIYRLKRNFPEMEVSKNRITNFSSLQHGWLREGALDGFAETSVLFDGIGGDVAGFFVTDSRLKLLVEDRIDELVEDIVGYEERLPVLRDGTMFPRKRAVEKVNDEFRKHLGAPDPISSFYFWNRTRRDIGSAPFAILRQRRKTVFAPYLDPDLSSFLAGLPPEITASRKLHADVIAKAYPKYADIPYAGKSAQSLRPAAYYKRIAMDVLRYILVNPSPMINRKKACLQLLRAMVFPSHCADVLYVGPYAIYLTELCKALSPSAATIHA